jgi:trans-2,3-dihydro-3-hydroxyanthranilate isomerase
VGTLPYEVVDVFTDRPFTGNPLAVVFDAHALSRDQMQAVAREFHLSETVFVLPPRVPEASYRVRIFTPVTEVPFAGHPSVGAAVTLLRRSGRPPGPLVQECEAGLIPIQVYDDGRATLAGGTPTVGAPLDPAPLLAMAGLTGDDSAGPAPRLASCGLECGYLPVRPESVARAACDAAAATAADVGQLMVFGWDPGTVTAHARVFAPGLGVTEDPATGSAALALGVYLVASGLLPPTGESFYTLRQGAEMHRPSILECTVSARDGVVESTTVTGGVVPVARGELQVPPFVG